MGGVANAIGQGVSDVVTLGTDRINGSPTKYFGDVAGGMVTGGQFSGFKNDILHPLGLGGGGAGLNAPAVGGQINPLQTLTMSGGAPLLTDIALGADSKTALMSYFGASGDFTKWLGGLSPEDQQAVRGLDDQLSQIQQNTTLRTQAVQKLADDFPNIMSQKIPQYSQLASSALDSASQDAIKFATDQISAKQAAGGMFSSGATAEAAARAGQEVGLQKAQYALGYGTDMAMQDFGQQFSQASALQSFQQKMLGQGAIQGFNAVQNALAGNRDVAGTQAKLNYAVDSDNAKQSQATWGALSSLGGTVLGGMFGGPAGAAVGGQVGKMTLAPMANTGQYNNVSRNGTSFPGPLSY